MARKSYVQKQLADGSYTLVEKHKAVSSVNAPMVMGDINTFVSPVDNSVVSSRSKLREHNKRNDVIDIGDERLPQKKFEVSEKEVAADVAAVINDYGFGDY